MLKPIRFPYDKSGRSPNNFVQDEPHELISGRDRRVVIPKYIPFYARSLIITDVTTGNILTEDDYYVADFRESIQRVTGKEVSDTLVITNKAVSDRITISYQVVGGQYSLSSADTIKEQLERLALDSRPIVFDMILGKPFKYPPTPHMHDIGDVYGMEYIVYAIDRLRDAILGGDRDMYQDIFNYIDQSGGMLDDLLDNLNELRMKIYGTTNRKAIKVIKEFMPVSPRQGNRVTWDEKLGGYYVGWDAADKYRDVYIDLENGLDEPIVQNPDRGSTHVRPFRTISFALEQYRNSNGLRNFYLRGAQVHEIPANQQYVLHGGSDWNFHTYYIDRGQVVIPREASNLDNLKGYLENYAATLIMGDTRDPSDFDGLGYSVIDKPLFIQGSKVEECHIGFYNLKIQLRNYDGNIIRKAIEADSSVSEDLKNKAKERYKVPNNPLFNVKRITIAGVRFISGITNVRSEPYTATPHSVIENECYLKVDGTTWFSGKLWDLNFSPEVRADCLITHPDITYVDDGTLCTKPTVITKSFPYLIDNLEQGDHHYHWLNLRTNIRPKHDEDYFDFTEGKIDGSITCEIPSINYKDPKDALSPPSPGTPQTPGRPRPQVDRDADLEGDIIEGDIVKSKRDGKLYLKPKNIEMYYKVYPAIWQGYQDVDGVTDVGGYDILPSMYQERQVTYADLSTGNRDGFFAYTTNKQYSAQVWPAVWQPLVGDLPNSEADLSGRFKRSRVFMVVDTKQWYIETIDKLVRRRIYPAYFEPVRNENDPNGYASENPTEGYYKEEKYVETARNIDLWSFGKLGVIIDGDPKYRGYKRTVEVLRDGILIRKDESKVMQLRDDFTQDMLEEYPLSYQYPKPYIDRRNGEVTWDYGEIATFNEFSELTDPIAKDLEEEFDKKLSWFTSENRGRNYNAFFLNEKGLDYRRVLTEFDINKNENYFVDKYLFHQYEKYFRGFFHVSYSHEIDRKKAKESGVYDKTYENGVLKYYDKNPDYYRLRFNQEHEIFDYINKINEFEERKYQSYMFKGYDSYPYVLDAQIYPSLYDSNKYMQDYFLYDRESCLFLMYAGVEFVHYGASSKDYHYSKIYAFIMRRVKLSKDTTTINNSFLGRTRADSSGSSKLYEYKGMKSFGFVITGILVIGDKEKIGSYVYGLGQEQIWTYLKPQYISSVAENFYPNISSFTYTSKWLNIE